jgi:tetratricopeptide (TPR) repeat protein
MSSASASSAASSEAAALLAANRRRRRVRRWIAIGTLPLTLAALLFVGKILSMYAFAHQSITSYVIGDHAQAISSARGQGFLNFFEPYKAPFNVGTGLAAAGELDEARTALDDALDLASGLEVCGVRINLAIVTEQLGDAAQGEGDAVSAAEYYAEALTITLETPEECGSPEAQEQSSDPERDMSDTLEQLEDRLQEKQQGTPPPEEEPQEQPQEPEPSEGQLDELQDRLDQGAEDREDYQQGDEGEPGSGTDRPW